ncbi:MAG: phosphoenolpyruvate carboxykinase (GTP) [Thermodesulfobacteriota bacterium]
MFELNKGEDILKTIGGITEAAEAAKLFEKTMVKPHLLRMESIENADVRVKIANAIAICRPERVYVNTASEEDLRFIRALAIENGEEQTLPMPGHTVHFDLPEEQGRIVDRTYYIVNPGEQISSLARGVDREQAAKDIRGKMAGIMEGRTMIIGFYLRGPNGSPVSNPAVEITSSAYVSHGAELLYCNAFYRFNEEVRRNGHFFINLHSQGENRPEDLPHARIYMDRSHRTTFSMNCTYAGNSLLMKKGNHRFAVDKAVYENRGFELAEHMFITGLTDPEGVTTWFTGAAPSGCGKTTTAMTGDHFIGDDLAQMWIGEDGGVRAVNPECGIFGILKDVNWQGDPVLMQCLRKPKTEVIWSNVLIDENGTPQWEGNGEDPASGYNFQGRWVRGMTDADGNPVPVSHPNSRCMFAFHALPNYSDRAKVAEGAEIGVITYSGRDSDTMPPVWVAKTPEHGVAIGACIVSAATAAEVGAKGVKRSPWSNSPFIPGVLGDYMDAQFQFFGSMRIDPAKQPVMAGLNYFLTDAARGGDTDALLGEKRDVPVWLTWLALAARKKADTIETPIGMIPTYEALKALFERLIGKPYPEALYLKQFSLYVDNIIGRIDLQKDAYSREHRIPARFFEILDEWRQGLAALKTDFGAVVSPYQVMESNTSAEKTG